MTDDTVNEPEEPGLRRLLREAPAKPGYGGLLILVVSLAAFALVEGELRNPRSLGIVIGVLLFHELGHWIGMRAFGYRDVRMFFIPLFGAAVSGKPTGVPPAKRAIVLLLGPVPGLVVAAILAFAFHPAPKATCGVLVTTLAFVNGLNLLPFEPFDGGRLAHVLVASRYRWLDVASLALGAVGLAFLGVRFRSFPLGFLAYLSVVSIPRRLASVRAAAELRSSGQELPEAIEDAGNATLTMLESRARARPKPGLMSERAWDNAVVAWCRETYERARGNAPSFGVSVLLSLGAAVAFAAGLGALFTMYRPKAGVAEERTQTVTSEDGHLRAHYPVSFQTKNVAGHAEQVTLGRSLGDASEAIVVTSAVAPEALDIQDVADKWRAAILEKPGAPHLVEKSGICHYGDGRRFVVETVGSKGGRFHSIHCSFAASGRAITYSIVMSSELYDSDSKNLIEIADATEVIP